MSYREKVFDAFGEQVSTWESGLLTSGELFNRLLDTLEKLPTVPFLRSILCLVPHGQPREEIKSQIWSLLSTKGQGIFTIRSSCGHERDPEQGDQVLSAEVFRVLEAWGEEQIEKGKVNEK